MANALGTLAPDVIAMDVLQFLIKKYPILTMFATDFSNEPAKYNARVVTRVPVVPAVQSYTQAAGYAITPATTTDVPVTLNQFRHVTLAFYDDEMSSTSRNLVDEQVAVAAAALGKDAADKLIANITAGNYPQHGVTTDATYTRAKMVAARQALVTAGAQGNKVSILDAAAWAQLAQDPVVINTLNVGVSDASLSFQDGVMQGVGGFDKIVEYADLAATDATLTGFFGTKNALIMCGRVPTDPTSLVPVPINGIIKNVTDPSTGLTIQYRYHYQVDKGRLDMTLAWIFGTAMGVSLHGYRYTNV
jgi:hypothetical protein